MLSSDMVDEEGTAQCMNGSEVDETVDLAKLKREHAQLMAENEMLRAERAAAEGAHALLLQTPWWQWSQMLEQAPQEVEIQPGVMVCFHGLKQDVAVNGMCGMVDHWHEASKRWVVQLPNGQEKITKPDNLFAVQPCVDFNNALFQANCTTASAERCGQRFRKTARDRKQYSSIGSWSTASSLNSSFRSLTSDASFANDSPVNTTVLMRNIPNHMSRQLLLKLLDTCGFKGAYDLLYLPVDFRTMSNLGYAFVNLVSDEEVERFNAYFTGFTDWGIPSEKACVVDMSQAHPGREAQIERHRNSALNHESVPDWCKPVLLKDGVRIPFPKPTRPVEPPHYWRKD